MSTGDGNMIYYVQADGTILGGTDSDNLDGITSLCGGAYIVYVDDATVSSTMNGQVNVTQQMQDLTPTGTNKFGIPIATGTFVAVPIDPTVLAAQQRQAIYDKYGPKIDQTRQNIRNAEDENKTALVTKQKTVLQNLLAQQNTELAGVTG